MFVNGLVSKGLPIHGPWLFVSWICLVAALLVNLFSYLTAAADHRLELSRLDEAYPEAPKDQSNRWAAATQRMNIAAAALLILGIVFLLIFVGLILSGTGVSKNGGQG